MVVNTRRLFTQLLEPLQIDAVCDIGSMDGTEALAFRAARRDANIFAFEANPANVSLMSARADLVTQRIRVIPAAATNFDGEAEFHVVQADARPGDLRRGMSSLRPRAANAQFPSSPARVPTTRIDTFLEREQPKGRVALWIDVEGSAYEAIEGVDREMARVQMLHVEVETWPCIASGQRLYVDVRRLLYATGFVEIATDNDPSATQFNTLFVRRDLTPRLWLEVAARLSIAGARTAGGRVVRRARRITNL